MVASYDFPDIIKVLFKKITTENKMVPHSCYINGSYGVHTPTDNDAYNV